MRVLRIVLAMAGVAALAVALFLFALQVNAQECEFPCDGEGNMINQALGPVIWVCIAIVLWSIAAILAWMERRFDRLSI